MRGEFIGVWSDTWREVWVPLSEHEGAPHDIFCELYRELLSALRDPLGEDAVDALIQDAVQLREAFERALVLGGIEIPLADAGSAFNASGATELEGIWSRREALEAALAPMVGSAAVAATLLGRSLRDLASDPERRAEVKERSIDRVINDPAASKRAFEAVQSSVVVGERAVVAFLEATHLALDALGGDDLTNCYFNLLARFIEKFSLRYELRRPCTLCPTLAGVFASLVHDLQLVTSRDAHLDSLRRDFEEAIRDLRIECSDARIRSCIQKQIILLEALGQGYPGVTENTLGAICGQVGTWPHDKVQEAIRNLYKFTNSYPGIRHAGTPATALRVIDMRDLVAVSILLTGFTPYLSDKLDADVVYRGT